MNEGIKGRWSVRLLTACRLTTVVACLAAPAGVLANGGTLKTTRSTPVGGIHLVKQPAVGLVAEDLKIDVQSEDLTFTANAAYELFNDGKKITVLFGVPLQVDRVELEPGARTSPAKDGQLEQAALARANAEWAASKVRIRIGGATIACKLAAQEYVPGPDEPRPGPRGMSFWYHREVVAPEHWCVSEITIPKGRSLLQLSYVGSLFYERWLDATFDQETVSERVLYYPLFPAGYWRGPAKRVTMTVNLGRADPVIDIWPAGWKRSGQALTWRLNNVDLLATRELEVVLAADERHGVLGSKYSRPDGPPNVPAADKNVSATASSELPAQGQRSYVAGMLIDGKTGTAWCEGVPGRGEGEWVELHFHYPEEPGPELRGITIVPGYTASQSTYRNNGRVRRLQLGTCGAQAQPVGEPIELAPALYFSLSLRNAPWRGEAHPECIRLTILAVEPGEKFEDTCISEVAPMFQ